MFRLQLLQQLLVDLIFVGPIGHLCSQAHVLRFGMLGEILG